MHAPCAVPRHPTATRTDTSSRREYDSRCAPRNVWLVVRIARRRERRQAGGGGGGGSQEADGRWQVAATPGGMGGLRQRREECEARATLERHRGAFGAPGRPLGRARWRSAAHELLPLMSASQRVVRCTRGTPNFEAGEPAGGKAARVLHSTHPVDLLLDLGSVWSTSWSSTPPPRSRARPRRHNFGKF